MANTLLVHLSRGMFSFLRPVPEEIRRIVPTAEAVLPEPQLIYLEDDAATPLTGFPVLRNRGLQVLEEALIAYLEAEENAQFAYQNRDTFDSRIYAARWERYKELLSQAVENTLISNYGQNYPGIFWLHHSVAVAQFIREVPRRLLRKDLTTGRDHGEKLKYRIFGKYVDRVVSLCYDLADATARELDDDEENVFPKLLGLMRDNVLIFTESYISPDLSELSSYFAGQLGIDGRDLRRRRQALIEWQDEVLARDGRLKSALTHLLASDAALREPERLLHHSGWVSHLQSHPDYDPERFFTREQVQVWEQLLIKLKEYEILHALRKMVVPLEVEGEGPDAGLVSRDRSLNTTWVGGPSVLRVSRATRPIDFMASWVVDPLVARYGLVYDITDFSATISILGRAEQNALDQAFRMMFRFQRRINKLAYAHRLKLEKYLGDGAFYSSRQARPMLGVAIRLQRIYRQALEQGFHFNRGLRVALNFGQYRLLPLESGGGDSARYEFFGHGLVELSRLATGKATQEIDEFRTYLLGQGYPEAAVTKFFAPLQQRNSELSDPSEESRDFYAYINENGNLINEGIVATEPFVRALGPFPQLRYGRDGGGRGYIVLALGDDGELWVGIRRLGVATFKGIDTLPVYEVVDAQDWQVLEDPDVKLAAGRAAHKPIKLKDDAELKLLDALKKLFAQTVAARHRRSAARAAAR